MSIISALMFGGLPGSALDLAFLRSFTLLLSPALLDELAEKLQEKFAVSSADVRLLRSRLEDLAEIVQPTKSLRVITDDPDDDRVLECAVEGHAHFIVSGDRHLLGLATYQGISIVTVRQFLESVDAPQ